MSAKRWLVLLVLIGSFSQSLVWAGQYEVKTLFEKSFDMEIEDVVLGEYQEQGTINFYPKIICLAQYENKYDSLRGLRYFTGTKEIRVLDPQGEIIKKIPWNIGNIADRCGYSKKGNYFKIYSSNTIAGEEYTGIGIFRVYNDKGNLMYEIDSLVEEYETGYEFYLFPEDGSAIVKKNTNPYAGVSYIELYDKTGKKRKCDLTERERYSQRIDIADNSEYMVSLSKPGPADPSVETTTPTVLFLDSSGNILWERSLKEKILSGKGGFDYISAKGSYVYASGYDLGDWVVRNGYVFNKKGELVMKISGGCEPLCFSPDENYLLVNRVKRAFRIGSLTKEAKKEVYRVALVDIKNKRLVFDKERGITGIPAWDGGGTISNDRKVSYINVDVNVDKGLGNRIFTTDCCIRVLDREGNHLWDSEPFYSDYAKVIGDNVRWYNSNLIYIWIDETRKVLQVKSVQFVNELERQK